MFRVVTTCTVIQPDGRKRQVDKGPWQPSEEKARTWAGYLLATGLYERVVVQSNGQGDVVRATQEDVVHG